MANYLWVEGLTIHGSRGFTVRWKESEVSGSREPSVRLGHQRAGESCILPVAMCHFRQISQRFMTMDDSLASIILLLFRSLWHQEALPERSGEKIEELCPKELSYFNHREGFHTSSLGWSRNVPIITGCGAALWDQEGNCISFRLSVVWHSLMSFKAQATSKENTH